MVIYEKFEEVEYGPMAEEILWEIEHKVNGKPTQGSWDEAWNEVYYELISGKVDLPKPKYFNHSIYRYDGRFIKSDIKNLEEIYSNRLKDFLIQNYLYRYDEIIEFGCGSGRNLFYIFERLPDKRVLGTDWVNSPKKIINFVNRKYNFDVKFHNMWMNEYNKIDKLCLTNKTCGITFGSMEQLGEDYKNFLKSMLDSKKFQLFIHVEPILELYNNTPFDQLAVKYHKKRKYLEGFLPALERKNVIILQCEKSTFGTKYNDGYSVIVWHK